MSFDPERNTPPRRAIRAGLIALARGRHVIHLDDWQQAATAPNRPLTPNDSDRLKGVSVSDEVIRRVAKDESKSRQAAGADPQRPGNRWTRTPAAPKQD